MTDRRDIDRSEGSPTLRWPYHTGRNGGPDIEVDVTAALGR